MRYAAGGKGKRGATRVIYYVVDEGTPLYADQVKAVRAFAAAIKSARK